MLPGGKVAYLWFLPLGESRSAMTPPTEALTSEEEPQPCPTGVPEACTVSLVLPGPGNLQSLPAVGWEGTTMARGKRRCWVMLAEAANTCSPTASLERPLQAQHPREWLAWLAEPHRTLGAPWFVTGTVLFAFFSHHTHSPHPYQTQNQKPLCFDLQSLVRRRAFTRMKSLSSLPQNEELPEPTAPGTQLWEGVTRHLGATPCASQIQSRAVRVPYGHCEKRPHA